MDSSILGDWRDDLAAKARAEAEALLREKAGTYIPKPGLKLIEKTTGIDIGPPSGKVKISIRQKPVVLQEQIKRNRDTFYMQRGWQSEAEYQSAKSSMWPKVDGTKEEFLKWLITGGGRKTTQVSRDAGYIAKGWAGERDYATTIKAHPGFKKAYPAGVPNKQIFAMWLIKKTGITQEQAQAQARAALLKQSGTFDPRGRGVIPPPRGPGAPITITPEKSAIVKALPFIAAGLGAFMLLR